MIPKNMHPRTRALLEQIYNAPVQPQLDIDQILQLLSSIGSELSTVQEGVSTSSMRDVVGYISEQIDKVNLLIGSLVITQFTDKYKFLDNAYPIVIKYDGMTFKSVAHAAIAVSLRNEADKFTIRDTDSAAKARVISSHMKKNKNWGQDRIMIMDKLLDQKFSDIKLGSRLLQTHPSLIVYRDRWKEDFWGGEGNNLGKLLMKQRDKLWEKFNEKMRSGLGE